MDKNDVLRRIRYIFDFNDKTMISIFALGGQTVTRSQLSNWLKKEEDSNYEKCQDIDLSVFLNGLIVYKRGPNTNPNAKKPVAEHYLTNNGIFMKLKIALNLKAEEIIELLASTGFKISKHELSAFFRKPGNRHYRECKSQLLRNFIKGLKMKYRKPEKDITA